MERRKSVSDLRVLALRPIFGQSGETRAQGVVEGILSGTSFCTETGTLLTSYDGCTASALQRTSGKDLIEILGFQEAFASCVANGLAIVAGAFSCRIHPLQESTSVGQPIVVNIVTLWSKTAHSHHFPPQQSDARNSDLRTWRRILDSRKTNRTARECRSSGV